MMNGKTETKTGNRAVPGIIYTFITSIKLIFFNERVLIRVFLDKRLTYNLITIFIIMFALPFKTFSSGEIIFMTPGKMVESILITLIFISVLYVLIPKKKMPFVAFFRLFLAFEVVDVFAVATLFMEKNTLMVYTAIILGWYLSLAVVAVSKLCKLEYPISFGYVFFAFIFANFVPVLFSGY